MDQSTFPFRINDCHIPEDSSGYVYMIISIRCQNFTYIGKTTNLIHRLHSHNSGNRSISS